jgi:hypothetical protein
MLFDAETLFSDGQAVSTTGVSTNLVDGGAVRDVASGELLWLVVQITQAFTAAGAATLTVEVQTASEPTFASPTTLYTSPVIPVAELSLGARPLRVAMPKYAQRYLRLRYVVGTGPFTAGKLVSGLVLTGTVEDSARGIYPRAAYGTA